MCVCACAFFSKFLFYIFYFYYILKVMQGAGRVMQGGLGREQGRLGRGQDKVSRQKTGFLQDEENNSWYLCMPLHPYKEQCGYVQDFLL